MCPYKDRLQEVRIKLQKKSDNWYSRNEAFSKMTGDEVWAEGMNDGLFIESEKKSVYEDQNSLQQYINEEMQKDRERARAKFESDQYQALVAKGEQLRSPQTIIQPFVVAAAAPELVVAAYFGTQSGAMVGETYNACRHGTKADCASASAQLALMYGMYRLSRTKPGEAAPENPNLTFPRGTDVTNRSVFPPEVPAPTPSVSPKPNQIPAARAWDLHGKPLADPAFAKPGVPGGPDRVFVIPEPNGTAKVYVVRNGREEFFSSTDRTLAEQEKRGFITSKPEGNKLSVDELRGKRVLDLAAGTEGRTVRELRQLKIDVEGMDIALEESAKNTGFLHRGDIITGVPAKGQFDIAYEFYGGLAYGLGKDTKAAFQNAISRLRPGGTLYIAPLSENARKALKPFVDDLVKQGGQLKPTKIDPPGDEVWRIITPKGGA